MKLFYKGLLCPVMVAMLVISLSMTASAADVVLIAHPDVNEDSLSQQQVQNIFLGKQKSLSGGTVKLAIQKDHAVHSAFLEKYVKRTPAQFDSHYKKLIFTGLGKMPKTVADNAAMLSYVAKTPGALGYVSKGAANSRVKVIAVK